MVTFFLGVWLAWGVWGVGGVQGEFQKSLGFGVFNSFSLVLVVSSLFVSLPGTSKLVTFLGGESDRWMCSLLLASLGAEACHCLTAFPLSDGNPRQCNSTTQTAEHHGVLDDENGLLQENSTQNVPAL